MDARKKSEEIDEEKSQVETEIEQGQEKRATKRQRRCWEVNHGKVLRSHTRRNNKSSNNGEMISLASEWVSSRQNHRTISPQKKECEYSGDVGVEVKDEGERSSEVRSRGGSVETETVIALSSSCQQSSNERKSPPEQAELGGTTSKIKSMKEVEDDQAVNVNAADDDPTLLSQTGSSATIHEGLSAAAATIGVEVVRKVARKSKRNETSLQSSSHSGGNTAAAAVASAPTPEPYLPATQRSSAICIVGTDRSENADVCSPQRRTCSTEDCKRGEMSKESAEHSTKETCYLSTPTTSVEKIFSGKTESGIEGKAITGGGEWSPPTNLSDHSERDEEKEDVLKKRLNQDDEEELATSLKTLACSGQSETHINNCETGATSAISSSGQIISELAGRTGAKNYKVGEEGQTRNHQRDDDGEWQVAPPDNDEEKCIRRNLDEKEKSKTVLSACINRKFNMIQGGVETTPAGTEAPCSESPLSGSLLSAQGAASTPPCNVGKKKSLGSASSSSSSKKRSGASDKTNETSTTHQFKFKKPQQYNRKTNSNPKDNDNKNEREENVSGKSENALGELHLRSSVVEPKKIQVSSAYMNNLPYMGELTFDTRPRRGRKPKKADICHLISKNYGIHFPSATQLVGGQDAQTPRAAIAAPTRMKLEQSAKQRQGAQTTVGTSNKGPPPPGRPQLLPSTVPAFYNRDVSIVPILPSTWNSNAQATSPHASLREMGIATDTVPSSHFTLHRNMIQGASSEETISMFPLNSPRQKHRSDRGGTSNVSPLRDDSDDGNSEVSGMEVDQEGEEGEQDMPLNLCLRDDTGGKGPLFDSLFLSGLKPTLDVRWGKDVTLRINPQDSSSSPNKCKSPFQNISPPSITIIQGGKKSIELSPLRESIGLKSSKLGESSQVNLVSGGSLIRPSTSGTTRGGSVSPACSLPLNLRPNPPHAKSEISVSLNREDLSPITFPSVSVTKPGLSKRKKDAVLRQGVNSPIGSPSKPTSAAGSLSYSSSASSASSSSLSSLGGRLFGQTSGGINDGAEVSICKFKFTGGAKPSLQEKKMLSVDSGGNFRFYTDKANNGLPTKTGKSNQFALTPGTSKSKPPVDQSLNPLGRTGFMNELSFKPDYPAQQSSTKDRERGKCVPPLSTGFLPENEQRPQVQISNFLKSGSKRALQSGPSSSISSSSTSRAPQLDTFSLLPSGEESKYFRLSLDGEQGPTSSSSRGLPFQVGDDTDSSSNPCSSSDDSGNEYSRERGGNGCEILSDERTDSSQQNLPEGHSRKLENAQNKMKLRRKRRTRKSLMREKLEKTFKEKGFLIQTQQLESAEGATYCKFRQLRKFTRYLFRSWKDYLPDNVKEFSENSAQAQQKKEGETPTPHHAVPTNPGDTDGQNLEVSEKALIKSEECLEDDSVHVPEDPLDTEDDVEGDGDDDDDD